MIYLDYNATTPLCTQAGAAMLPFLDRFYGNPSSVHAAGRQTRAAIDNARDDLAALLKTQPHEIIFTGGGTESNNLAVLGLARARADRGRHLISCQTEHHAVLNAFEHLARSEGFEVTWLPASSGGLVDLEALQSSLRPDTQLVSIMSANNETGVIQPLPEISAICRRHGVLLHSDMVQSFAKCKTDLALVDAASFAAHKFYGPKGTGFLYLRSGVSIEPIMFGGAHENQRRPGTESPAAIAGMAAAGKWTAADMASEQSRQGILRDLLRRGIQIAVPSVVENGAEPRLANTLNISFPGVDSETMLMALDLEGVGASSGSACMVGSVVASHVLLAMNLPIERAASAIRFSLGKYTTREEIDESVRVIERVTTRLTEANSRKQSHAAA